VQLNLVICQQFCSHSGIVDIRNDSMKRFLAAGLFATVAAGSAFAADLPSRKASPVAPAQVSSSCKETSATAVSSDIFGFSTGSDVSDVAAWALSGTYAGAYKGSGFKPGSFNGHTGQFQASTSFFPCWEIGPYLIGTTSSGKFRGVPGEIKFDALGAGVENKYKVFGRATHGFGLTLVWDANYQGFTSSDTTVAPLVNYSGKQLTSTYKLLLDRELISGKLYGAFNVQYDQIWAERPGNIAPFGNADHVRTSNLTLSTALSYQLVDGFFLGGEARYVRSNAGSFFNKFAGDAVYVGPTMFWQATKSIAVSGAWGIQVAGNPKAVFPGTLAPQFLGSDLNLASQNQHIAKLKIAYGF
jgi:opacity protein-like surface antigen